MYMLILTSAMKITLCEIVKHGNFILNTAW